MRILLAGGNRDVTYSYHEGAWAKALRKLGHTVIEFRTASYLRGFFGKVQQHFGLGPLLWRVNRDFLQLVRESHPDVIVCYRALLLYEKTIQQLQNESEALLVCYQNDNVFGSLHGRPYWRHFRAAIPHYDFHLVYRRSDIIEYRQRGAKQVRLLRSHYLPWLHQPLPREEVAGWESDICFVGHCEPDARVEQMDTLMRQVPARYRLYGPRWNNHAKGRAWEGMNVSRVLGKEYSKAINGTKVALAFLSTWNQDTYTRRSFEIPACGAFMLSQRTDDLLNLYEEDTEAVFFSSAEELVDKARYYLAHDRERARIADAGYQRCTTSGYDIYSRMQEWLGEIKELRG